MISVVVPFYNAAEHLPRALECLETLDDVEILLSQ